MPYEKQTWVKGDKITAAKLNHLEDGVRSLSEEKVSKSSLGLVAGADGKIYVAINGVAIGSGIAISGGSVSGDESDVGEAAFESLPFYWQAYLPDKISILAEKDAIVSGHGDSFAFVTDSHYPYNTLYTGPILKYIMSKTALGKAVHGGDAIQELTTSDTAETMVNRLNTFFDSWDGLNFYAIPGNHDGNSNSSANEYPLTEDQYYDTVYARFAGRVTANGAFGTATRFDYYIDNADQKIRYIMLFTGLSDTYTLTDAQVAWMQARIMELSGDWTVVIISHQHINGYAGVANTNQDRDTNGKAIQEGLAAISPEATIACCISGHQHQDYAELITTASNPYMLIVTTCDCNRNAVDYRADESGTSSLRQVGTTDENAFDVFHIDTAAQTIYATRIGAGYDRVWSYGDNAVTYHAVTRNLTNCGIDNTAARVIDGDSFTATVTANDGYTLKSVACTMGGAAVTVTDGVINIPSATGDIVITALAQLPLVNVLPLSIDGTGTLYNGGQGWKTGYRLNSSGAESAASGYEVTGFIECALGDVFHFANLDMDVTQALNNQYIAFYDSSFTKLQAIYANTWYKGTQSSATAPMTADANGDLATLTIATLTNGTYPLPDLKYFRISALGITSDTVITRNQEID